MACKICNVRRARRSCPGVGGEICSVCCGTEREVTVSCPLDCAYLREARTHEKPPRVDPQQIPNLDIEVSDSFLHGREALVAFLMQAVAEAGLSTPKAVDYDVRAALDALVRTSRTRETGLYYETRPDNLLAAAVLDHIQKGLEEFRQAAAKRHGIEVTRDADVLGVLVFLQRIEYQINNGRQRGRAFLDFLRSEMESASGPQTQPGSSLVLP